MKKLLVLLMLSLVLVGCTKPGDSSDQGKVKRNYEIQFKDGMNCYRVFYETKNGTTYYTEFGTIEIKFSDTDWMNLNEAIEKKLITYDKIVKNEAKSFKMCKKGDTHYPCGGGC